MENSGLRLIDLSLEQEDNVRQINECNENKTNLVSDDGMSSLAQKLSPLKVGKTVRVHEETLSDSKKIKLETSISAKQIKKDTNQGYPFHKYPSTMVTMTNNMAAIQQHSKAENTQRELIDLIKNVLTTEKQITKAFSSVSDTDQKKGQATGTKQQILPEAKQNLKGLRKNDKNTNKESNMNSVSTNGTKHTKDLETTSPKKSVTCAIEEKNNKLKANYDAHEKGQKKDQKNSTKKATKKEKLACQDRADNSLTGYSNTRAATSKSPTNFIVLTVTHPSQQEDLISPATAENVHLNAAVSITEDKSFTEQTQVDKILQQLNQKAYEKIDPFYLMDGKRQSAFLESALFNCRKFLSKSQCIAMLDDYKVEYTHFREEFHSKNKSMGTDCFKDNIEGMQREVLYKKILYHTQKANNERHRSAACVPRDTADASVIFNDELSDILEVIESCSADISTDECLSDEVRASASYMEIIEMLTSNPSEDAHLLCNST